MTEWIDIFVVLLLGSAVSWLSRRLRFPNAVAQVLLGVLIGTAVLEWVPHTPLLHRFGEVGVVILLGLAGLELGFSRLVSAGWAGAMVALLGIAFSVAGGFAMGRYLYAAPIDESLYLALALGATSIGITAQILEQYNLIGHRTANIILAAAVIDDVVILYLLGSAHGLLNGQLSGTTVVGFVLLQLVVLGGLYAVCRFATQIAMRHSFIENRWWRNLWVVLAVSLASTITHVLGLSSVVGAFFAGMGIGDGLTGRINKLSVIELKPLALIMMPFFFVMIGVQAQWDALDSALLVWLLFAMILFALLSKALSGVLGSIGVRNWRDRWLIGFGMVARGEVGLIIATLGFEQGHLSYPVFVTVVLTTIVVSVLGPLMMVPLAKQIGAGLPNRAVK